MVSVLDLVLLNSEVSVVDALRDFELDPLCELIELKMVLLCLNIHRVNGVVDPLQKLIHNLLDEEIRLVHDHGKNLKFEEIKFLLGSAQADLPMERFIKLVTLLLLDLKLGLVQEL